MAKIENIEADFLTGAPAHGTLVPWKASKVGVLYAGTECVLNGTLVKVTGSAGGEIGFDAREARKQILDVSGNVGLLAGSSGGS